MVGNFMNNFVWTNREILKKSNYIRKADPQKNYWLDFSASRLQNYINIFGNNFNVIILGSEMEEGDFYIIPFSYIKHILIDDYLSNDKDGRKRWVGIVKENHLKI